MMETINFYHEMLRADPHRVEEVFLIATDRIVALKSADAVALFDLVLAAKPEYFQAWGNRGNALDDFRRVLELQPDHAVVHQQIGITYYNRGVVLQNQDHYAEACARSSKCQKRMHITPSHGLIGVNAYSCWGNLKMAGRSTSGDGRQTKLSYHGSGSLSPFGAASL
jgi:tetratricopeptide (TPR) repeat protein